MDKNDFWTLIVAAVGVFLASLPALLDSFSGAGGVSDNFGNFRWLLIAGPLAIIGLAGYGRAAQRRTGDGGEVG